MFSDTVGFIRNLPPALVAAFRATLEEVREAELLLMLLDASDPEAMATYEVIVDTLTDIGCEAIPRILVLNKLDAVSPEDAESLALWLRAKGEDVAGVSALHGEGLRELLKSVERMLASRNEWFTRPASFDVLTFPER